jgi:2-keto-4-pentenoate hydratase
MTAQTQEAAEILLAARQGGPLPSDLPESCRPRTRAEAYEIQAAVAPHLGPIGGWKVGAPSPDAIPMCSPLPQSGILFSPANVAGPFRYRGVEAEIVFHFGQSLPPRDKPYDLAEVTAAIDTCHAGIEVIECRYAQMDGADHLSALADLQNHHAFVIGPANPEGIPASFATVAIALTIDGVIIHEDTGSNPAKDLMRLLLWLVNEGAVWAGGVKAGDWVTTGSWVGKYPAPAKSTVIAQFDGFPPVTLSFDA